MKIGLKYKNVDWPLYKEDFGVYINTILQVWEHTE